MINTTKYPKIIGIYKITSPTNRIYIGQSINILKRWNEYKNGYTKKQPKLHRSIQKYGVESHQFEIIEELNKELLDNRETFWKIHYLELNNKNWQQVLFCELYDSGGGPKSEETRRKMSESQMGNQHRKGKKDSDETKNKKSKAQKGISKNKGYVHSPEHNLKISKTKKEQNFKFSDEQKFKMSNTKLGWNITWGDKIGESKRGIPIKGKLIIQFDLLNNIIREWDSMSKAARYIGKDSSGIKHCCDNKQNTCGGFKWKYKN